MYVLQRKCDEQISISSSITITVLSIEGNRVELGIEAPRCILVRRTETLPEPVRQVFTRPERRRQLVEA